MKGSYLHSQAQVCHYKTWWSSNQIPNGACPPQFGMRQKQVLGALGQPKQMKQLKQVRTTQQSIMSGLKAFSLFKGKMENFAITSDLILLHARGEVGVPTTMYTALPHAECI